MIFRRSVPDLIVEEIRDQEEVTQRVCRGRDAVPEINAPRPRDMGRVSVIRGRVTPSEAYDVVRKGGTPGPDDGARYTTVAALRRAGFVVTHSPNPRNPDHVSVSYPGDWGSDVALLFKSCFAETLWKGDAEDD